MSRYCRRHPPSLGAWRRLLAGTCAGLALYLTHVGVALGRVNTPQRKDSLGGLLPRTVGSWFAVMYHSYHSLFIAHVLAPPAVLAAFAADLRATCVRAVDEVHDGGVDGGVDGVLGDAAAARRLRSLRVRQRLLHDMGLVLAAAHGPANLAALLHLVQAAATYLSVGISMMGEALEDGDDDRATLSRRAWLTLARGCLPAAVLVLVGVVYDAVLRELVALSRLVQGSLLYWHCVYAKARREARSLIRDIEREELRCDICGLMYLDQELIQQSLYAIAMYLAVCVNFKLRLD
ncbi:hypothetical protein ONE63_004850 [Megalurothrips usitatus]|uniref:Gustatory receptor n=1 Tax=Megalurothrips usitatus TaxID=439358 RepID=A0AAV7X3I0_9NEOP|nr:hypothetical protein ONE63_004850 [Megalurothrips usitatus]